LTNFRRLCCKFCLVALTFTYITWPGQSTGVATCNLGVVDCLTLWQHSRSL
jgi:hypothetical protein